MSETNNPTPTPAESPKIVPRKPKKLDLQLRVSFTEKEILEKGRKLAQTRQRAEQVQAEFDSVKTSFKSKLETLEATSAELVTQIANGFEYKSVACETTYDDPAPGAKTTRRLDLNEIIENEPMTQAEMQGELALHPPASPPTAAPLPDSATGIASDGTVRVPADGKPEPDPGF